MGICHRYAAAHKFPTETNAEEKLKMHQDAEEPPTANRDDTLPPKIGKPMRNVNSDAGSSPTTQNVKSSIQETSNANTDNVPLLKKKKMNGGVE